MANIEVMPAKDPKSADAIVWFLQGLIAAAYNTEITEIKLDYLTKDGWVRTAIK